MWDIEFIKNNLKKAKDIITSKKVSVDLEVLIDLDTKRRNVLSQVEDLRRRRNEFAEQMKDIAQMSSDQKIPLIEEAKQIKEELSSQEDDLAKLTQDFDTLYLKLPNIPSDDTPVGFSESENMVLRKWGTIPEFGFTPQGHDVLGEKSGMIDSVTAANVSGARFVYLKGDLVLLQFALIGWVMSKLTSSEYVSSIASKNGLGVVNKAFLPVLPPVLMREEVMGRMARLEPKDDRYQTTEDGLMLVGSAEHTLGPIYMDKVLDEKDLPLRMVGYSSAFRREAGTYGKDMKGLIRLHQFDKIEIESFTTPDKGMAEQDLIVAIQENLMQELKLPYQVVLKCTGDMGTPDHRALDIETWFPAQNKYRETHTSDYMTNYQSYRLGTRVKLENGDKVYAHMNDATVFAFGRIIAAIMENYQNMDGSIRVPEVLEARLGKDMIDTNS
jgi:seryl-tRNA synthetase